MEINSKPYWDNEFIFNWEVGIDGKVQTQYFMTKILEEMPARITAGLNKTGVSICDVGCALGQGVNLLSHAFPKAHVHGLDFSSEAIERARMIFPRLTFHYGELFPHTYSFDMCVCSNTLEHFHRPIEQLVTWLDCTKQYFVILVPFRQDMEYIAGTNHFSRFDEMSFPFRLRGFIKREQIVINCDNPYAWIGPQLFVVYERSSL